MTLFTRLILALFGMAFAVLFTACVLIWLAFYTAFASLRWLVTGQKPQVVLMWQQIQSIRKGVQPGQGARWSNWSRSGSGQWDETQGHSHRRKSKSQEVEDALVREVQVPHHLPKD